MDMIGLPGLSYTQIDGGNGQEMVFDKKSRDICYLFSCMWVSVFVYKFYRISVNNANENNTIGQRLPYIFTLIC